MRVVPGVLFLLAGIAATADASPHFDPTEKVEGKSLAEWSVAWWQWALPIKKENNPCSDKTGEFAHRDQKGLVFFLAGAGGGKIERACQVPAGKPIVFPVINDVENAPPDRADEKSLRATARQVMDRAVDLEVVLDGKSIPVSPASRVASPLFSFTGPEKPEDGLFDNISGKQVGVSDGYWIVLKPLSPGEHTLRFKASLKAEKMESPFRLDVTYRLTVVAMK